MTHYTKNVKLLFGVTLILLSLIVGCIPVNSYADEDNPEESFTVSFDVQGHGSTPESQTITSGGTVTKPEDPTADGFTFGGWYKEASCETEYDFSTTVDAGFTLYAKWTGDENAVTKVTVTFDVQGYGSVPDAQEIASGSLVTQPQEPVADGLTFGGWYKETGCENVWDFGTETVSDNTTIYAKWTGVDVSNGTTDAVNGATNDVANNVPNSTNTGSETGTDGTMVTDPTALVNPEAGVDPQAAKLRSPLLGAGQTATLKKGSECGFYRSTVSVIKWDPAAIGGTEIQESGAPVYIKKSDDGSTMFVYSDADKIYANRDCSEMFAYNPNLIQVDGIFAHIDTSNVENMSKFFSHCSGFSALDLTGFNTSNVTNMSGMFSSCSGLTALDLTGFNSLNVTDMSKMFYECSGLSEIDLTGFNTSNVLNMTSMFEGCSSLTSLDLTGFNTSNVTGMSDMFNGCSSLTSLDLTGFNTSNVLNI